MHLVHLRKLKNLLSEFRERDLHDIAHQLLPPLNKATLLSLLLLLLAEDEILVAISGTR